jgi:hypothetical protein
MEVGTGLLPAVSARGGATIASCPRTARTRRPPPPAPRPFSCPTAARSRWRRRRPRPPRRPRRRRRRSRRCSRAAPRRPTTRRRPAPARPTARATASAPSTASWPAPSSPTSVALRRPSVPVPIPSLGCVGAARRVGVTCGASASGFYCPFMRVLYIPRLDARVGRRRAGASCPGLRIGGDAPGTPIRPSVLPAPLRTRSRD